MTTATLTVDQATEISAASQRCHPEGLGIGLAIFADGSFMESISSNDVLARGDGNGGWDHRVAYINTPMDREEVAEYLAFVTE